VADFSFDSAGRIVEASVKGATADLAGATTSRLLGSAITGGGGVVASVATGLTRSAVTTLSGAVGGTQNLNALLKGAESASGAVSDLFTGKTSLTGIGTSIGSTITGAVDTVVSDAKAVAGTVSDLFTGKTSISAVASTITGKVDSLLTGKTTTTLTGTTAANTFGWSIDSADLGSQWGALNLALMARLFVCDSKGVADLVNEPSGIYGALTEGAVSIVQNWQSPFENTGPETKAPALTGMLQSGSLVPVLSALQAVTPADGAIAASLNTGTDKLKSVVKDLQGRTGITKLNSTQVFSGMPPVKFNFTIHFRALSDPDNEVAAPLAKLLEWVFPQELAAEGILSQVISTARDVDSFIKALFPSKAPKMVGLTHGGRTYSPMVIENVDYPLDSPMDAKGRYINLPVTISMSTLTALDRPDIKRWFGNGSGITVNS